METIEVVKAKLIKLLIGRCPYYFFNYQEGECCMRKVNRETCNLHVFAKELECPQDCPRLNTKEYGCDRGRCSKIKTIIKNLKP